MGRPIKKSWFSVKEGSPDGDLTVTSFTGDEVVINQKGTGVYTVASGRVKLVDAGTLVEGEAHLQHNGNYVRKLSQYRAYYFDAAVPDAVWRNGDGTAEGTFLPALTPETPPAPIVTATVTATAAAGLITGYTVTDGGSGYVSAPAVAVSAPDGTSATATAVMNTEGSNANTIASVSIDDGGSGYTGTVNVTFTGDNGVAATGTVTVAAGVVTIVSVDTGGSYDDAVTAGVTIDSVTLTQESATATISGDAVATVVVDAAGAGYVAAPTVTVTP